MIIKVKKIDNIATYVYKIESFNDSFENIFTLFPLKEFKIDLDLENITEMYIEFEPLIDDINFYDSFLIKLNFLIGKAQEQGRTFLPYVVVNYLPNLRQDKDLPKEYFTTLYKNIRTFLPHSYDDYFSFDKITNPIVDLDEEFYNFPVSKYVEYLNQAKLLVFPDKSAKNRFEDILMPLFNLYNFNLSDKNVIEIEKHRNIKDGSLTFNYEKAREDLSKFKDLEITDNILFIDDIISYGGTIKGIKKNIFNDFNNFKYLIIFDEFRLVT